MVVQGVAGAAITAAPKDGSSSPDEFKFLLAFATLQRFFSLGPDTISPLAPAFRPAGELLNAELYNPFASPWQIKKKHPPNYRRSPRVCSSPRLRSSSVRDESFRGTASHIPHPGRRPADLHDIPGGISIRRRGRHDRRRDNGGLATVRWHIIC